MDRRPLLASALGLAIFAPYLARAADGSSGKRRLGVLLFDSAETWNQLPPELSKELGALGWVEGRNLDIDWRFANGDAARLRAQAMQLVATSPDAILSRGTPAAHALQQATKTIPLLAGVGDPVGSGLAETLARPGGNITGLSWAFADQSLKQLELMRQLAPKLTSLVIVASADRAPFMADMAGRLEVPARALGLVTRTALVGDAVDLQRALRGNSRRGELGAVIFGLGNRVDPKEVARVAIEAQVPTMFEYRFYVDVGGLASYHFDWENQTQRAAAQIDKVFRGEKASQIPFELPTRSEFVLNRSTARALGLTLQKSLLSSADAIVD
jgi:putative tryptophan/tyrosine transport system substrate-binding protein